MKIIKLKDTKKRFFHLLRYSLGYILGGAGYFLMLYFLTDYNEFHYVLSAIISFFISIFIAFNISKVFAFEEKWDKNYLTGLFKYALTGGIAAPINLLVLIGLTEWASFHYLVSALIAGLAGFIVKYMGDVLWCFKKV